MSETIVNTLSLFKKRWLRINLFNGKISIVAVLMLVTSILLSLIVITTNGKIFFALGFLAVLAIVFISFYNLEWGFYIFIALVFITDNFDIPPFSPFTYIIFYHMTLNVMFSGLGVGVLSPLELHLIFLIFVWIVTMVVNKNTQLYHVPLWFPALLFFGVLIFSTVYGKMRGGDPMIALWEVRALSYFGILFFWVPQIVTKKEQIQNIFWVFIWVISFKAFQEIERFISLGFNFGGKRTLANHEDPLFFITIFLLLVALTGYRGNDKQRKFILYLTFPLVFGFYIANRRATYAAFAVCMIIFIILLTKEQRRKITKYIIAFSIVFAIYLAAFWNSYGRIAMVASAVRSTYLSAIGDKESLNYEDYTSGLARDQENYNLAVTFRTAPVLGIGLGNKHEWVIKNYGAFSLKGYVTHNQILWLMTNIGCVGFFLLFFFLNCIVMRGTLIFIRLKDPYLRGLCAICVLAVFGQVVVSYVDMQLTFSRNMVHLGLLTGLIPVIERIDKTLTDKSNFS